MRTINVIFSKLTQISIRRVVRLPLNDETMHPCVPPRLWRSSRTMPGSPRSETPIIDSSQCFQRNFSSLSNFREGFDSRIQFSKLLRVGRSFRFLTFICLKLSIVFLEHLCVPCFDFTESLETPEIFERCVLFTLCPTKFCNLSGNLSIGERHLTLHKENTHTPTNGYWYQDDHSYGFLSAFWAGRF
jgi:hypothetical protein